MKQLTLAAMAIICLTASCRKCRQCELTESVNDYEIRKTGSEFCGSNRKMRQHENEQSNSSTVTIGQTTVTYKKEMDCN